MVRRISVSVALTILTLFSPLVGAENSSQALSPYAALSKIRERLLGDWPHKGEWEELEQQMASRQCRTTSCLHDFFRKKMKEYMSNSRYVDRMTVKVEELFYIRSGAVPFSNLERKNSNPNAYYQSDSFNALSDLSRRVFAGNRPWDELFTSKIYQIYPNVISNGPSERLFYGANVQSYSTNSGEMPTPFQIDLQENPNAAGAFSTPKFVTRFWNSSLNQGRKRSAAVFRIMVCDTLFPSLERKAAAAEENAKATGFTESAIAQLHTSNVVNRHATDPACIRCHERLDPLAWTMRGLERGISQRAFPGYVRFYDESGKLTKFKAESFSEAIETFTKQSRYRSCQVDRFFKWIIGKDVEISNERARELESDFDRLGRRTNDFIAHLLLQPEFLNKPVRREKQTLEGSHYEKAVQVFGHCVECHGSSYPFTDLKKWDRERLEKITWKLDLPNNGLGRQMPPASYTKWQPSQDEILAIKDWISAGAPDSAGSNTVSKGEAAKILEAK